MDFTNLTINSERLQLDFDELSDIGATVDGGVSRLALSNEDLQARAWLANRFVDAGLAVRDDDAGNLSGVLPVENPEAQTLLIGSHLDSVPNGGLYDGSIGVLAGLECLRIIRETGLSLPVNLEVIDFTDEEGNWQSLFGSRALTGKLDETYLNDRNGDFAPFRAALFRAGIRPTDVFKARRDPSTLAGYLELHIEQGYQLDQRGIDIGVVTGIVGRTTYGLTFYGEASHSGTTAIAERRDALHGAADFIWAAHQQIFEQFPEGVYNCGNLEVQPGAFNIIPSEARLTMEVRHTNENLLMDMESHLIRLAQEKAAEHRLTVITKRVIHMPAVAMSERVMKAVETACQRLEISHVRIPSYAGHDAQMMSTIAPTSMIFVPSVGGISHSPREFTEWKHVVQGANVLLHTILRIALDEDGAGSS